MLSCQKDLFSLPDGMHFLNCATLSPLPKTVEAAVESRSLASAEEYEKGTVDRKEQPILVAVEVGHPNLRVGRPPNSFHTKPDPRSERPTSQGAQHTPARVSNRVRLS